MFASQDIGKLHLILVIDAMIAMKLAKSLNLKIMWKTNSKTANTLWTNAIAIGVKIDCIWIIIIVIYATIINQKEPSLILMRMMKFSLIKIIFGAI